MILSIIIIMILTLGTIVGLKRGGIYQFIKMIGIFVVFVLSFLLKNLVATIFLKHFNFIDLTPSISIVFYRIISFILLFFIFRLVLKLILKLSKGLEKILKATIILSIPSKIIGAILGFIEYYVYLFIALLILSLPIFKIDVKGSRLATIILKQTPVVSSIKPISLISDISLDYNDLTEDKLLELLDKYELVSNSDLIKYKNNKE